MIRIDYGPRLIKTLRRLGPEIHAETEKRLTQIAAGFGHPHQHGLQTIAFPAGNVRGLF